LNKKKLLISAFNCHNNYGSENEVGYRWVEGHIEKGLFEIFVLTQSDNLLNLNKNFGKKINIIPHKIPFENGIIRKFLPRRFYYYIWHLSAYFMIKNKYGKKFFNIIHHVSWATIRFPIFLCLLDCKFIYGPIGGGEIIPFAHYKNFNTKNKIVEFVRYISIKTYFLFPFAKLTLAKSNMIFVSNKNTLYALPKKFNYKSKVLTSVGVVDNKIINIENNTEKLKIIFVGRLLHWKGIKILLEVIKKFENLNIVDLTIVGEGPEISKIKNFANDSSINIEIINKIRNIEMISFMSNYDLLFFPTLRDSGGFVILEALKAGIKVLTINTGGPAELLSPENGRKINIDISYSQFIDECFEYITQLHMQKNNKNLKINQIDKKLLWSYKIHEFYNSIKKNNSNT